MLGRTGVGAVPRGEGDHVPAPHVPRGGRRTPRGAHGSGRDHLLPPKGSTAPPHPAQHFMIRCKGTPAPMAAPHAHPRTPHEIRTQTKHPTHNHAHTHCDPPRNPPPHFAPPAPSPRTSPRIILPQPARPIWALNPCSHQHLHPTQMMIRVRKGVLLPQLNPPLPITPHHHHPTPAPRQLEPTLACFPNALLCARLDEWVGGGRWGRRR